MIKTTRFLIFKLFNIQCIYAKTEGSYLRESRGDIDEDIFDYFIMYTIYSF